MSTNFTQKFDESHCEINSFGVCLNLYTKIPLLREPLTVQMTVNFLKNPRNIVRQFYVVTLGNWVSKYKHFKLKFFFYIQLVEFTSV